MDGRGVRCSVRDGGGGGGGGGHQAGGEKKGAIEPRALTRGDVEHEIFP